MKKLMKMLVAMMMALSLAACSGGDSTEEQENTVNNFFKYVSECNRSGSFRQRETRPEPSCRRYL